ncbi:isocitrate lyase/PEP mutase family protein [Chitinophaga vietnamensis]|uniref:isocitrate lyase/PEP mutase family protein n=1 Tax=Chitinophaga vietnamensis TaxID=2593957 RepID=UPI0011780191|nr:isocitrate lyase/phosphoenolpyruvate mutase family protein [Chitinophaga vietnamensis]
MNNYEKFKQLHAQDTPLLIGNAWNVRAAQLYEEQGLQAVATTSSAIAESLGYEDGENIPFSELLYVVGRIAKSIKVPLSADIERGYSNDINQVLLHLEQLHDLGVVGFNIEDSYMDGTLKLLPVADFSQKLAAIRNHIDKKNLQLFINARIDPFLAKVADPLAETLPRLEAFAKAGADGLFVPFIKEPEHIRQVTSTATRPVNVLAMAGLPDFPELAALGVKRISVGGSVYRATYAHLSQVITSIQSAQSVSGLF